MIDIFISLETRGDSFEGVQEQICSPWSQGSKKWYFHWIKYLLYMFSMSPTLMHDSQFLIAIIIMIIIINNWEGYLLYTLLQLYAILLLYLIYHIYCLISMPSYIYTVLNVCCLICMLSYIYDKIGTILYVCEIIVFLFILWWCVGDLGLLVSLSLWSSCLWGCPWYLIWTLQVLWHP